ncbi:hypothetical protein [Rhizorhabdus sp.]|uniref:hypothetical protein n=1 Tax=Rhizorhabdus sp. TaxID=1968843 RepID=UPI0035B0FC60
MKQTVVRDAEGRVINIGPWDYGYVPAPIFAEGGEPVEVPEYVGPPTPAIMRQAEPGEIIGLTKRGIEIIAAGGEFIEVEPEKPGEVIPAHTRPAEPGELLGYSDTETIATNPLPEGTTTAEEDIVTRDDGGLAAAADHVSLRVAAYPSIADQLDALWKGGEALDDMRARVLAVKDRFPKS